MAPAQMGIVLSNYSLSIRFHTGVGVLLIFPGSSRLREMFPISILLGGCCGAPGSEGPLPTRCGMRCVPGNGAPGGRRGLAGRSLPGAGLFLGKRKCWIPAELSGGAAGAARAGGFGEGPARVGGRGGPGAGNALALTQRQLSGAGGGGGRGSFESILPSRCWAQPRVPERAGFPRSQHGDSPVPSPQPPRHRSDLCPVVPLSPQPSPLFLSVSRSHPPAPFPPVPFSPIPRRVP